VPKYAEYQELEMSCFAREIKLPEITTSRPGKAEVKLSIYIMGQVYHSLGKAAGSATWRIEK
jgi:hypothetical protein